MADLQEGLRIADELGRKLDKIAENGEVISKQFERMSTEAVSAFRVITDGAVSAALLNYSGTVENATVNIQKLGEAVEKAGQMMEFLGGTSSKTGNIIDATLRFGGKVAEETGNKWEAAGQRIQQIAGVLEEAKIADRVLEAAEAVYKLIEAFSEAESIVVRATGATGSALDGLTASMMEAYAVSKTGSLDETAAVIGEVNTRLGYTGERLTETTGLFLDFAAVTGGNAASTVRNVTQLMNQWNIPAIEMEDILDKLTYAGQASGISVDKLTQQLTANRAVLGQLGFSLDEAAAMFMKFELAGTNSAQIMAGFRTTLSGGEISSMEELYNVFERISSGAMTAAEATELFGSSAGPAIVNAVNSGVLSLDDMVSSLSEVDGTLSSTATTAQTLEQKWTQAGNHVSAAFTTALYPIFESISSALADMVNGIGDFLNEHPIFTKAIAVLAAALGGVAIAFAAISAACVMYQAVMVAATAVTEVFGITLYTALLPITLIVAAVASLAVVIWPIIDLINTVEEKINSMTAANWEQYHELENLNAEYEKTCLQFGETSDQALLLKNQMDELSAEFEANKQTLEEFMAEVDAVCQSVSEVSSDFDENMAAIRSAELGSIALIQKYEELTAQTRLTAEQEKELEAVTKKLAENYPDLAEQMDNAALSADDYVEAMKRACEQEAEDQKQRQTQDSYVQALIKRAELTEELAKANENLRLSQEKDENSLLSNTWLFGMIGTWASQTDDYEEAVEELNAAWEDNERLISNIEGTWRDSADAVTGYEEVCMRAFRGVQEDIDELVASYSEAYEAARRSIDQTIGLFDTMSMECDMSTDDMLRALESQAEYLKRYIENINLAEEYGLNEMLIISLSDGSEKSAAYLNAIVREVEELGKTTDEAIALVQKFNNLFSGVDIEKDIFSETSAESNVNYLDNEKEIKEKFADIVLGMGSPENVEGAAEAARSIMEAYTNALKEGTEDAVAAAEAAANAVSAALGKTSTTAGKGSVIPKYTDGNVEEKNFPELGAGKQTTNSGTLGGVIFPTLGDGGTPGKTELPPLYVSPSEGTGQNGASGGVPLVHEKKITLEIAGSGAINVEETSKERLVDLLQTNLKPMLMNMIQGEIYEEGELSYDY